MDTAVTGDLRETLALYGMVMYGFYTFFSVPQVVKGLSPDRRLAVRAIVVGLALNGILMGLVAFVALGVSQEVTKLAITGIADALGTWAGTVGAIFIFVALVTTTGPSPSPWRTSSTSARACIRTRAGCWPRCPPSSSCTWAPEDSSSGYGWPEAPSAS